ncbi:Diamine acetyltransferase 1 [Collichthys lucidus]|uniref:Diamine acetyltransferase 1 n=1 Tax=Collichthys lucidus TaxID=240159 RepID=A0A4U5VVU5_COLLU|nr:Diamine acetyltransferase 1 [Collichthys lucidus]
MGQQCKDHPRETNRKDLEQDGFSKNPFFHSIIAEVPEYHKTKEGEFNTVYFTPYEDRLCTLLLFLQLLEKAQLGLAAGCNQLDFTDMGYHCMICEGEALQHLAQP